jgi:hypothetical protein
VPGKHTTVIFAIRLDPAGGEVLGEQGQLGEAQGQQVMELVDEAGALADDGLEAATTWRSVRSAVGISGVWAGRSLTA